ncbi:MAG: pirin family protein [Candidatus Accumulibacter phosphatis]|nr:pirin family protein [Candidatus Accumulibacter contiguus]
MGNATSDGAGVKLTRVLDQQLQHRLDPFLMLDAFGSDNPDDYIAGFPDHPHRGFETITYMIAGRMLHRDSAGHQGLLESGGVQWMTAGRGVIHSEIPQQEEGVMEGFQLWLNLPAKDKMSEPWYRDFTAADLPRFTNDAGTKVTVIAGTSHGLPGAVTREATMPLYLDLHLPAGSQFTQALPAGHNAFVYVYRGTVSIAGSSVPLQHLAILANDPQADGVLIKSMQGARALLIAGRPLNESIVQYGPFVMNTEEEVYQAMSDYRDGRLA